MRSTVVPAQVTTVEDRIAGSLGLSQLLLLAVPIFGGSALFVVLPPFFNYAVYKVVMIVCFAVLCGLLAIRVKGKLLLFWLIAIVRYNSRPRFYVFNKNSGHLRDGTPKAQGDEVEESTEKKKKILPRLPQLSTPELVQIEDIIANPQANLHFRTNRKGELSVHITEVK
jgi:hypothetical protein